MYIWPPLYVISPVWEGIWYDEIYDNAHHNLIWNTVAMLLTRLWIWFIMIEVHLDQNNKLHSYLLMMDERMWGKHLSRYPFIYSPVKNVQMRLGNYDSQWFTLQFSTHWTLIFIYTLLINGFQSSLIAFHSIFEVGIIYVHQWSHHMILTSHSAYGPFWSGDVMERIDPLVALCLYLGKAGILCGQIAEWWPNDMSGIPHAGHDVHAFIE